MTIADQITRLNNAKAAIKQSIENKGVEVSDTALLDEYPALIDSIEVGGDGGDPYYRTMWNAITNNNTNYSYLFHTYNSYSIDTSNLDTSNVTNMNYMFYNCTNLTSLDLSNWNTSNVTNMSYMFFGCESLTSLDLSNFDTSNVTAMTNMFGTCTSLTSIDISNWNTINVTAMTHIFNGCNKLHTLRLDNCSNDTISKIITSRNFPTNIVDGVIRTIYCKEENAAGLTPPTNWVFEYIEAEPEIPDNTIAIYTVNDINKTSPYSVGNKAADWEETVIDNEDGTYTVFVTGSELPNKLAFSGRTALVSVSYINTSNITDMRGMFTACNNLTSLDVSGFNTSKVTSMQEMFHHCDSLTSLDLSNFDTSNVTNMSSMFYRCHSLTELDLSNFDTSNVTDMDWMFGDCGSLHTLHLDNCNNDTISKIITLDSFPVDNYGTIYCRESEAAGLTPPGNWVFSYID